VLEGTIANRTNTYIKKGRRFTVPSGLSLQLYFLPDYIRFHVSRVSVPNGLVNSKIMPVLAFIFSFRDICNVKKAGVFAK
jgi:hypothetical protein